MTEKNKRQNKAVLIIALIYMMLVSSPAYALTQNLTYDVKTNQLGMTYDSLNRILSRTSDGLNTNYIYDKQYNGTLTNVTYNGSTYNYEYDGRLRIVHEVRIIDGIKFEKRSYYDSMDRVTGQVFSPGKTVNYTYNNQGLLSSITGFITNAAYDAFSNLVSRNYANNLITQFTYDSKTERLKQIKTSSLQQLDYSYDNSGNVISINDPTNGKTYNMVYDFLNRLVRTTINGDVWEYTYNSIGNILKMKKPDRVMYYSYGSTPVHAPSKIDTLESLVSTTLYLTSTTPMAGDKVNISCLVNNINTSSPVQNYNASIFIDSNKAFSGITDSTGYVRTVWNTTTGTHIVSCQAGDDLTRFLRSYYNDSITVTPKTRGNIAYVCRSNKCNQYKEDEIISWLRSNGWDVTNKSYQNWTETDLKNYDLIVCSDEAYGCAVNPTTAAYKVHKNNNKPIVEITDYYKEALAAYMLGYLNTSATLLGSNSQNYINVTSDPITSGYYGKTTILSSNMFLGMAYNTRLNPQVVKLAEAKTGYSTFFKVDQSGTQGRFVWIGWLYEAYPSNLNVNGTTILLRSLNWAKCGNANGCS